MSGRAKVRVRVGGAAFAALGALAGSLAGASAAGADDGGGLPYTQVEQVAKGVTYGQFTVDGAKGPVTGYMLTADLSDPRVRVNLLTPGAVAARAPVSQLADAAQAVGAVNGDFFNISEEHAGVTPTGSSDGPEISSGRALKAAVPNSQRFGPAMPPGETTQDVLGVGVDRRARLDRLALVGSVRTRQGSYPLGGFNQYALPEGGIGAYTSGWGTISRERAVCGSDTARGAACSTDTYEVTVRGGRVTAVADTPGEGAIEPGSTVLVGRDAGADTLRTLKVGDRADVGERLAPSGSHVPYTFAVGGFPVLRDGAALAGLDAKTAAVRTAAGFGDHGRTLYLLALDGTAAADPGLTVAEVADVMRRAGADDAVNLDGGGSTTMVTRTPDAPAATVRNNPSGVAERPVANAVGVFSTGR
ncbi:Predicted protein [Actinacidiphila yanglinensis]|uniref:Phosphodiester glycosidase domain-containing protein n=1 Tax=Actinacidiphila yanglinensis TaxID=310779 RepID=A0A1H5ZC27_9ACTN|nr:phosphodiester glycosidase family protein [Actinacidiphila yanglinensis]SEG33275.1 Predicted protein [Actinacidiphila yanglinensis]